MKATGIVRRIDDLGRVVIPKEIRRVMRIREGDPLEIFTDREGEVIFKKYSPIGELSDFAADYCESLHKTGGLCAFVCDCDAFIAAAGVPKKEFLEQKLPEALEALLAARGLYRFRRGMEAVRLADGFFLSTLAPILAQGDLRGAVGSVSKEPAEATDTACDLCKTAAAFLAKQLEE